MIARALSRLVNRNSRSAWFRGFLWAEGRVKELGLEDAANEHDGLAWDWTEFDRGVADYYSYYERTLRGRRA